MNPVRCLLLSLALAPGLALAAEPGLEPDPGASSFMIVEQGDDIATLKQQLADSVELAAELRNQIDTTQAQADTAAADRDRLKGELEALRQQRDALQGRAAELQRATQRTEPAPQPAPTAELAPLREQLAVMTAARDGLSVDGRNLANELRSTRAERDKFQASSVMNAERSSQLMSQLNDCRSGRR